jgi:hypothetical protein
MAVKQVQQEFQAYLSTSLARALYARARLWRSFVENMIFKNAKVSASNERTAKMPRCQDDSQISHCFA